MSKMTKAAAARIQSVEARNNDGVVSKSSFATRAQRAAANNEASGDNPNWPAKNGNKSGGGRGNNPPKK